MTRVQVVYASRHGGTEGIASRIAEVLRAHGADAVTIDAVKNPVPDGFDAYVVGSGVYLGKWLPEGIAYIEHNLRVLAARPLWLFSSGPVGEGKVSDDAGEALESALGPASGPGSGGHRKIDELTQAIEPREHRVFGGVFDPTDPPKSMMERIVRIIPAAKRAMPARDNRDWEQIDAWATEIAEGLVPVR
jgi:menaquinone-dependent protoporphyrinogen oxidase